MPEAQGHISSAILRVRPGDEAPVAARVAGVAGCEVAIAQQGRLVVLIETASRGATGAALTELTLLDGVHSACMVYEQVESLNSLGETA
ncbi:chaperone NapD (plasmid) [Cereibacter azotoformans]|uniref:Chaperone NapD n=2 Tax=Cereibacter TaxID=1653176 RepID=A0A2T5JW06_9RHOB|nr:MULTISPECIES: chaperone NapD [Cereibacter]PTR14238.1 periplasmic nitrate reductase chaperone NapD [Cereibacter azotoformans]